VFTRFELPIFVALAVLAGLLLLALIGLQPRLLKAVTPGGQTASIIGCWLGDCSVDVNTYAPTCTLSATPADISPGDTATLNWNSNILSPYLTPLATTIDQSGSQDVAPNQTTTYTLYDHAGAYNSFRYWLYTILGLTTPESYCITTLTVSSAAAAPSCLLSVFPEEIVNGASSTLYYSISGNTSSSNIQNIGPAPADAPITYSVAPDTTTTYKLSVAGPGGSNTCTTTLTVDPAPVGPYLSLKLSPSYVMRGGTIIMAWSAFHVSDCLLKDGGGNVIGRGLNNPIPAPTFVVTGPTTYTLECVTSDGAMLSKTASVGILKAYQEI